jgi:hypothetical protein
MDEAEANQALKQLDQLLRQKKIQVKKLQEQIDTVNSRKANLKFELERERARKQTPWWWIILTSLLLIKITAWGQGRYVIALICEYSFLAMWRNLYVRQTKHAIPVAICTIAISLYAL